ncbi:hypothetical protein NDK43_06835 [Neobacillus pocheonensis]|uniref:DUF3221 domain-containing protein n=1 Tax=Neobacillus pocheonensis TaxID=363869 RepID=A0ABT0W777_9BACI|nr:hypothetical protein [Neobacillus pocheonensis]
MGKFNTKYGLILLTSIGLVGCSQNQTSSPSIHKDLLDTGSKLVKIEYSIAASLVIVDTTNLDNQANVVSDLWVDYTQHGNGLNKTESKFVDDVVNSRVLYENLMTVRGMKPPALIIPDDKKTDNAYIKNATQENENEKKKL